MQSEWRKAFGAAGKACRAAGNKPGTKDFGSCMKTEIRQRRGESSGSSAGDEEYPVGLAGVRRRRKKQTEED